MQKDVHTECIFISSESSFSLKILRASKHSQFISLLCLRSERWGVSLYRFSSCAQLWWCLPVCPALRFVRQVCEFVFIHILPSVRKLSHVDWDDGATYTQQLISLNPPAPPHHHSIFVLIWSEMVMVTSVYFSRWTRLINVFEMRRVTSVSTLPMIRSTETTTSFIELWFLDFYWSPDTDEHVSALLFLTNVTKRLCL